MSGPMNRRQAPRPGGLVRRLDRALDVLALIEVLLSMALEWGYLWGHPSWMRWTGRVADGAVFLLFAASMLVARGAETSEAFRRRVREAGLLAGIWVILVVLLQAPGVRSAALLIAARQILSMTRRGLRHNWARIFIRQLDRDPAKLLATSFAAIILAGTFLLMLPPATRSGTGTPLVDALFTATSATCVTGLIVVDTPTYFSRFGEWVLVLLIQVGGLGIMTISTAALLFSGRQLSSRGRRVMQDVIEEGNLKTLPRTILFIVKMTFFTELAGAALLFFFFFLPNSGRASEAAFSALFHSVSAFCNAGFSVFSDNLMGYRGHVGVNLTIAGLIVLGGLGFTVVAQMVDRLPFRSSPPARVRWSVHVDLVLVVTALLLLLGTVLTFFFEFDHTMLGWSLKEKLLSAFFQSVTPRTAGFNTIPFDHLRPITLFFTMVLMFIGGSPGSTAGGIKTSTLAVLALSVRAMLSGRQEVESFGRTIPQGVVYRATAIAVLSFVMLSLMFAVLLITQDASFDRLLFEAVSAFGTVGLSTGITPTLTPFGKLTIVALMYIGRTGPLTLTLALSRRARRMTHRLPEGRVMVG